MGKIIDIPLEAVSNDIQKLMIPRSSDTLKKINTDLDGISEMGEDSPDFHRNIGALNDWSDVRMTITTK